MLGPFDYSSGYGSTFAPVTRITISWRGKSRTLPALLDSGASRTCIPQSVALALSLKKRGEVPVGGATAPEDKLLPRYVVDLTFFGQSFTASPVLGISKAYALVGRDILNEYTTCLDGPALQLSLTPRP